MAFLAPWRLIISDWGGFTLDPFVRLAHGLAISENLLGISSVQVDPAFGREHGGKADQECNEAYVYPAQTHAAISLRIVGQIAINAGWLLQGKKQSVCESP